MAQHTNDFTGGWLVEGAWRRTVWGTPAGGVRQCRERRLAAKANG